MTGKLLAVVLVQHGSSFTALCVSCIAASCSVVHPAQASKEQHAAGMQGSWQPAAVQQQLYNVQEAVAAYCSVGVVLAPVLLQSGRHVQVMYSLCLKEAVAWCMQRAVHQVLQGWCSAGFCVWQRGTAE